METQNIELFIEGATAGSEQGRFSKKCGQNVDVRSSPFEKQYIYSQERGGGCIPTSRLDKRPREAQ